MVTMKVAQKQDVSISDGLPQALVKSDIEARGHIVLCSMPFFQAA